MLKVNDQKLKDEMKDKENQMNVFNQNTCLFDCHLRKQGQELEFKLMKRKFTFNLRMEEKLTGMSSKMDSLMSSHSKRLLRSSACSKVLELARRVPFGIDCKKGELAMTDSEIDNASVEFQGSEVNFLKCG